MTTRTSDIPTWFREISYANLVSGEPSEAASICDEQVSKRVGMGTESPFEFRGVIQEEMLPLTENRLATLRVILSIALVQIPGLVR